MHYVYILYIQTKQLLLQIYWSSVELSVDSTSLSLTQRTICSTSPIYINVIRKLEITYRCYTVVPLCLQYIIVLFSGNFLTSHILLMIKTCMYISHTVVHVLMYRAFIIGTVLQTYMYFNSIFVSLYTIDTKSKLYCYSLGITLNDFQCLPFTHWFWFL